MKVRVHKYPLEITKAIIREIRAFPKDYFYIEDIRLGVSKTNQVPYTKVVNVIKKIVANGGIKRFGKDGSYTIFHREKSIYSKDFDLESSNFKLVSNIVESLPNEFTFDDIFNVVGKQLKETTKSSYITTLVKEGKICRKKMLKRGHVHTLFSKTIPTHSRKIIRLEDAVTEISDNEEVKNEDLPKTPQGDTQFDYLELGKSIEAVLNEKSKQIRSIRQEYEEVVLENERLQEEVNELKQDHQQSLEELTQLRQQVRKQQEHILDLQKKFTLNNFKQL